MALLELFQFTDLLLDLAGDGLISFSLSLCECGAITLEFVCEGRHATDPLERGTG